MTLNIVLLVPVLSFITSDDMGSLDRKFNQSPAAVVGRPGENQAQITSRLAGLSDEDTGYTPPAPSRIGGGRRGAAPQINAFARSATIANQRERMAATQSRFEDRQDLAEREFALKQHVAETNDKIHAHAVADAENTDAQTRGFLNFIDAVGADPSSPRGSRSYLTKVLAGAGQYPAAINHNQRLAQMVQKYDGDFKDLGGHDDSVQMLSELGSIDPNQPGIDAYLRTLPGKYVNAVGDKATMKIYDDTMKLVASRQPQAQVTPPGMAVKSQTITGPDGNAVLEPQANADSKQQADQLKLAAQLRGQITGYESQLKQHDKNLSDLEKGAPEWLNTTGIFTDSAGTRRFGFADKTAESSPVVTPALERQYNDYGIAQKSRADLQSKIPQLNSHLDDVLAGKMPADLQAAGPNGATMPVTRGGDSSQPVAPVSPGNEYTDPAQVKADYQAKRLTQDQAASILRNQFGHQ